MSHSYPHTRAPPLDSCSQLCWMIYVGKKEDPCIKKSENVFTYNENQRKKKSVSDHERARGQFPCFVFSLLEVVLLCMCVVLHLHIEGVLSKRALAGKGWGGGGGQYDGLQSKGRRSDGGQ